MPGLPEKLLLWLTVLATGAGCKPQIGDDCTVSTDCSAEGVRLCDITAPGGYCTIFNCEPNNCPEDESLCVMFNAQPSWVPQCEDKQSPSPYERSFCMATCKKDNDCRDGYVCRDLSVKNEWNAILIDKNRGNKACLVPVTTEPVKEHDTPGFGDVCHPKVSESSSGGTSSGGTSSGGMSVGGGAGTEGDAGAGGTAGAGGESGAAGAGG